MKLAWLCYETENDVEISNVVILFSEPKDWYYFKIVPIVYAEIIQ